MALLLVLSFAGSITSAAPYTCGNPIDDAQTPLLSGKCASGSACYSSIECGGNPCKFTNDAWLGLGAAIEAAAPPAACLNQVSTQLVVDGAPITQSASTGEITFSSDVIYYYSNNNNPLNIDNHRGCFPNGVAAGFDAAHCTSFGPPPTSMTPRKEVIVLDLESHSTPDAYFNLDINAICKLLPGKTEPPGGCEKDAEHHSVYCTAYRPRAFRDGDDWPATEAPGVWTRHSLVAEFTLDPTSTDPTKNPWADPTAPCFYGYRLLGQTVGATGTSTVRNIKMFRLNSSALPTLTMRVTSLSPSPATVDNLVAHVEGFQPTDFVLPASPFSEVEQNPNIYVSALNKGDGYKIAGAPVRIDNFLESIRDNAVLITKRKPPTSATQDDIAAAAAFDKKTADDLVHRAEPYPVVHFFFVARDAAKKPIPFAQLHFAFVLSTNPTMAVRSFDVTADALGEVGITIPQSPLNPTAFDEYFYSFDDHEKTRAQSFETQHPGAQPLPKRFTHGIWVTASTNLGRVMPPVGLDTFRATFNGLLNFLGSNVQWSADSDYYGDPSFLYPGRDHVWQLEFQWLASHVLRGYAYSPETLTATVTKEILDDQKLPVANQQIRNYWDDRFPNQPGGRVTVLFDEPGDGYCYELQPTGTQAATHAIDPVYCGEFKKYLAQAATASGVGPQDLGIASFDQAPCACGLVGIDAVGTYATNQKLKYFQYKFWSTATGRTVGAVAKGIWQASGKQYPAGENLPAPYLTEGKTGNFTYRNGHEFGALMREFPEGTPLSEVLLVRGDLNCNDPIAAVGSELIWGHTRAVGAHWGAYTPKYQNIVLREMAAIARGGRYFDVYAYGPTDIIPDSIGLNERSAQSFFTGFQRTSQLIASAEDALYDGVRPKSEVAVMAPQSDPPLADSANIGELNPQEALSSSEYGVALALMQSHHAFDFIPEERLPDANALSGVKVLYVTRPSISNAAYSAVQKWVQAGGTLVLSGTLAEKNEFGEPSGRGSSLGVSASANVTPDVKTGVNVTTVPGGASIKLTQPYRELTGGTPLASLTNGKVVATSTKLGSGQIRATGFDLGAAYAADPQSFCANSSNALDGREGPHPKGYDSALRSFIVSPVEASGVVKFADATEPLVDLVHVTSTQSGDALVAANYSDQDLPNLTLTVPSVAGKTLKTSGASVAADASGRVTLKLARNDVEVLTWNSPSASPSPLPSASPSLSPSSSPSSTVRSKGCNASPPSEAALASLAVLVTLLRRRPRKPKASA